MKKLVKSKILLILFITCSLLGGLGFSQPTQQVYAATSTGSSKQLTITSFGNYCLFPNGNGIADIDDYFGYYCKEVDARKTGSTDMLEHRAGKGVSGSYKVGHFFSDIMLPQNYINAGKNGALVLGSAAYLSSEDNPFWGVSLDSYVENVVMELSVGTGTANNYEGYSASSSTSVTEKKPREFVYRTIENWVPQTFGDFIRLHFYTTESSSNDIIMKIKSPNITISTNDTTKPTVTGYTYDSATRYASDKFVYVNVADNGSGVQYVKVNGANATLHSISEDTKTATYKFAVSGCNTYNIEVVDNVGNSTTTTYTTNKITTSVVGNGTITNDIYTFAGDTVTLTATANEGNRFVGYYLNGSFVETTNTNFDIVVNGDQEVVAKFKTIANVTINKTEYLYTGSELTLDYQTTPANLPINFTYTRDGNNQKFLDVGEYVVVASINTDEYVFEGTFNVVVNRQVQISIDDTAVTYNTKQQGIKVTTDCVVDYEVIYSVDGQVVTEVVDAQTYTYQLNITQTYHFGSASGTFTINPKTEVIALQDLTYTYDGTQKQATVVCDFDYSITYNELTDLPVNAGSYLVSAQITTKNYVGSTTNTLVINKRKATFVADNKQSVYGDQVKELTYTTQNLVETDNIKATLVCDLLNKVGSYDIKITEIENPNYEFTFTNAVYTITARPLTIVCAGNQNKIYGEQDPALGYEIEQGNLVFDDELSGNIVREQGEDAGQYAITQGTLANSNYEIEFVDGVFSILARRVVVKINPQTKIYGDVDQTFTYSNVYGNFVDEISLNIVRDEGENVGTYNIYLSEFDNANYDLTCLDNTLTINQRQIEVVADNIVATYGEEKTLTYQIANGSLAFEDILSGNLEREQGKNVGTYNILIGTLQVLNPNYKIDFVNGTYQIDKRPISIVASGSKMYGENDTTIEYQITDGELVKDDYLTGNLNRVAGETAGQYTILIGTLNNDNYDITLNESFYEITKRPIVITAFNQSKIYGQPDSVLTYQIDGLLGQDIVQVQLKREQGEDAGTYNIVLDSFSNANYFVQTFNPAIYTIECANVPFVAVDFEKTYDSNSYVVDMSDFEQFNYSITYTNSNGLDVQAPVDADTYVATISFADNKNYFDKTFALNITINKQFVSITVDQELFIENGKNLYPKYYLNYDVNSTVNFENPDHSQVGFYNYTIVINEANYFGEVSGVLEIIANPVYTNEQGDKLVYVSDAFDKEANVDINVDRKEKELQKAKDTLQDFVKHIDVNGIYSFESTSSKIINSNYVANLKLGNVDASKVKIFEVNENGDIRELEFSYENEYASFNICDLNSKIIVTTDNEILKKALIGSGVGLVLLVIAIFVVFGRKIALLSFVNRIKARKKKREEQKASANK